MLGLLPTLALRHWKLLASGLVLALLLTWGGIGWNRAGHWKKAYLAEHQAYGIFRARVIDRTTEATAKQNAVNAAFKKETTDAAKQADETIGDLRDNLRAARLRAERVSGQGSRSSATGEDHPAPLSQGLPAPAGSVSGQVCLAGDVADGLAAYAIKSHNLAADLVKRGVAEFAD